MLSAWIIMSVWRVSTDYHKWIDNNYSMKLCKKCNVDSETDG